MPGKRDVVLFDLDGTVLDTYNAIMDSMRYATEKVLGAALPDAELAAKVGQPLVVQMQTFAEDHGYGPEVAEELTTTYRAYNERDLDERSAPFEGIAEAIWHLRQHGYETGVVTSKRVWLATNSVKNHGLASLFSCVNGAEDSKEHKPHPEPLLNAAKKLGVEADRCIYIGDSPYDLQAAKAAGMPCVAVTWGKFFTEEVLKPENPNQLIHEVKELVGAVETISTEEK